MNVIHNSIQGCSEFFIYKSESILASAQRLKIKARTLTIQLTISIEGIMVFIFLINMNVNVAHRKMAVNQN